MAEPARSRRSALVSLILSLAGGAALWRFLTPRGVGGAQGALAVAVADVPESGALVLPQHQLAVVRERGAFFAVDLVCTHLACTVQATEQGFACPCHGSRFTSEGRVLSGPAPEALRRLRLEARDGVLWITPRSRASASRSGRA
jgi:Rieske Fe-S protein